jgi:site-specific recombinase XerD
VRALEDDNPTKQLRDRSILLIATATGFKRSELVFLEYAHLHWRADGLQFAAPRKARVPYHQDADVCPVRTLQAWLDAAAITDGPLFCAMDRWGNLWPRPLCAKTVSRLVKRAADAAGLDPEEWSSSSLSR